MFGPHSRGIFSQLHLSGDLSDELVCGSRSAVIEQCRRPVGNAKIPKPKAPSADFRRTRGEGICALRTEGEPREARRARTFKVVGVVVAAQDDARPGGWVAVAGRAAGAKGRVFCVGDQPASERG